jgi:hypothetical protein
MQTMVCNTRIDRSRTTVVAKMNRQFRNEMTGRSPRKPRNKK